MSQLRAPATRPDRREGGRHGRPVARPVPALPETDIRSQLLRLAVLPPVAVALSASAAVLFTVRSTGARTHLVLWAVLAGAFAVAVAAVVIAAVAADRAARSVGDRVDALRRSTARGEADLRSLVEALRRGEGPPPRRKQRGGPPRDADDFELLAADLARAHEGAVTAVVHAAQLSSQAGSEQKLEVFVNLARRLQSLVHREISILDELENEIEDPDLLKGLFHVDHLATRIRRHAENLAVLGGAVSRRQWSNPVSMTEVLRSAIAEVEQYSRVKLVPPIDGELRGHAVADVIHLLAELVENATVFSAPHTQVLLRANLVTAGLAVEVEDRGLGMPVGEQNKMNALLSDPDQVNVASLLADGRIGLFVVSQLARRHGIDVRLQSNIYGGVQAVLIVPRGLLGAACGAAGTQGVGRPRDPAGQLPAAPTPPVAPAAPLAPAMPAAAAPPTPSAGPVPPAGPVLPVPPTSPVAPFASAMPAAAAPPMPSAGPVPPAGPVAPVPPTSPVPPFASAMPATSASPMPPVGPVPSVGPVAPVPSAPPVAPLAPAMPVAAAPPMPPAPPVDPAVPAVPAVPVAPAVAAASALPVVPVSSVETAGGQRRLVPGQNPTRPPGSGPCPAHAAGPGTGPGPDAASGPGSRRGPGAASGSGSRRGPAAAPGPGSRPGPAVPGRRPAPALVADPGPGPRSRPGLGAGGDAGVDPASATGIGAHPGPGLRPGAGFGTDPGSRPGLGAGAGPDPGSRPGLGAGAGPDPGYHPGPGAGVGPDSGPGARPSGRGPAPLPVRGVDGARANPADAVPGIRPDERFAPVPLDGVVRGTMERPRLPRRRAQEHLVPQLRGGPAPRQGGDTAAEPDPGLMAAFQRGIVLAESQQHPDTPTTGGPTAPRPSGDTAYGLLDHTALERTAPDHPTPNQGPAEPTHMGATDMGAVDMGATHMGATHMGPPAMGAADLGVPTMGGAYMGSAHMGSAHTGAGDTSGSLGDPDRAPAHRPRGSDPAG
ncbi:ATP-binding protein [Streptomyces sp. NPDC026672]|uniref:ATP-binding protein n=1 Tax=unclassified Streptomyces TaxID=2593676 RepID=UPI0033E3F917